MKLVHSTGRVLSAWIVVLVLEHLIVGIAWRDEFAGAWELWPARTAAAPLFIGVGLLGAVALAGVHWLSTRSDMRPIDAVACVFGFAVGWGVGTGRHFANPLVRTSLALGVALAALLAEQAYRTWRARSPRVTFWVLALVSLVAWWVDAHVLVRLYPAFHLGLFVVSLAGVGLAAIDAEVPSGRTASAAAVLGAACLCYAPFAAQRLRTYDNLRRVLVEHAPWMGRAVHLATVLAPVNEAYAMAPGNDTGEVARALDWTGLDVVLVSIDALRADHVGAYGYARPTTPAIDALAKEGTLFRYAYCPTPHTSYSVTSMMTGKYMRPLLALGIGQDSDTLAGDLRRYGYRTAAFYPPAVFFIDESKFESFETRALDFEYRKVEFADPVLREAQVREYLGAAPQGKPLLLWVHFFEPHEPYVQHPEHRFGDTDLDAYDSEVATADDGVARVVRAVRAVRPNAVVVVTADHGEEFGEHGGRYHGTTVYEEQVRVPLVVVGKGVRAGASVDDPVQTVDILPTVLSAMGIPRPPRVRGRDLGGLLGRGTLGSPTTAFAETDGTALLAKGPLRLVCDKQADACALFDVTRDAGEKHDLSATKRADAEALRGELVSIERSHGRYEEKGADLPDALRRGAAGDVAAAPEVASLLDDVNVVYRREAARILFDLSSKAVADQLTRAASRDDDEEVRGTCAAALVRMGVLAPDKQHALLTSASEPVRQRAALAMAEHDDAAGVSMLVQWLTAKGVDFERQREVAVALGKLKARSAVPALVGLLGDVRLRGIAASALGAIGDPAAKEPLLEHFRSEPYVLMREPEGRALVTLGARKELAEPLERYAGLAEPTRGLMGVAALAGVLTPTDSSPDATWTSAAPTAGPLRLGVLVSETSAVTVEVDGKPVALTGDATEKWADVPTHGPTVAVHATTPSGGVRAFWLVPAFSAVDGGSGPGF